MFWKKAEQPKSAEPPCAGCTGTVLVSKSMNAPGGKKIEGAGCCGALVCIHCFRKKELKCLFCKRTIPSFYTARKRCISNWEVKFQSYERLEQLKKNPFFFDFLKFSGCIDFKESIFIQQQYNLWLTSQVVPRFFMKVMQFRLFSTIRFMFQPFHHITRCRMVYSLVKSGEFVEIYQDFFGQSAIFMKYCRKFLRFGCIFFITLKLSTMLLPSEVLSDVNAISRIISRFTKNNLQKRF
jgi:hypothetical protein